MTACSLFAMTFSRVGPKPALFRCCLHGADEVVYASPAEGGAQTALATVASQLGKRATIFVAERAQLHPRTLMAKRLGAQIVQVSPGYLNVVQARAREYSHQTGARSSAVWLRHTGSRTSDCSGAHSHRNTARRSVVCGWFRRLGARSSSGLAECQPSCRPGWPHVKHQRRGRRNDSRISQDVRMGD